VVAVAAVLTFALIVTRPFTTYSTDEGAAILQAQVLDHTGSWIIHDPARRLDPAGAALPIPKATSGPKGRAPYAKHPLYPLILLGVFALGGADAYVVLSAVATLVAAVIAGRLARRVDRRAERMVLWGVAVASPLLFDAMWVLAHSLAAATGAIAALLMVGALEEGSHGRLGRVRVVGLLAGSGVAVALTAGLRTEGLVFGVALGLGGLAWAAQQRRWVLGVGAAAAAFAGAAADRLGERLASQAILGNGAGPQPVPEAPGSSSWLSGRIEALRATLLHPSYATDHRGVLVVGGAVALALAGLAARRHLPARTVLAAGALGTLLYGLWFVEGNRFAIPGLLVACPAIGAAVMGLRRSSLRDPRVLVLAVTAASCVVGVLLTEYAIGGGNEWGGRYFAVALPVAAVPLAMALLSIDRPQRDALLAGIVGTSLVLGAIALASVRDVHQEGEVVEASIARCARLAGPPDSPLLDSRPLVVTTKILLPQGDWQHYDQYEWLAPNAPDLDTYLSRAAHAGVGSMVLVSTDPAHDLPAPGYRQSGSCLDLPTLAVVVLRIRAA